MPIHSFETMVNTYLLDVIIVMQPFERREFLQWIKEATVENNSAASAASRLFETILQAEPDFSLDILSKDNIYKTVFGHELQVQGKLEKLMAEVNKQLRTFLLIKMYTSEENEIVHQIHWAKWLRERGLPERARHSLNKLNSIRTADQLESLGKYQINLLIAEEEHMWESTYNRVKGDLHLPKLIEDLDLYFLNYRADRINRYLLQQKGAQLPDLDLSLSHFASLTEKSLQLEVNLKISQILFSDSPDGAKTLELMAFIAENEQKLSTESIDHAFAFLRNSCTLLINAGHLEFVPIQHQIHLDNLKRGYFFVNGEISPNAYVNLVQIGTRANEIVWAKEFTEIYRNKLIGGDSDLFFYKLNMAQCCFSEGNFEKASDFIPESPSNSHYHHIARRLELKIYYELDSDLLLFKIDSFRKFIERTASKIISDSIKEMHLNFLKILHQLAQSPPKDKARSARLIKRIEEKKFIAERSWLLEKARELG